MFNLLAIGWEHYAFTIPLSLLSVFLMMVILVQRGRGGGLTGALGGMGGQSAFGTKAGDLFTRITVGVAAVWVLLSMAALKILNKTGTMDLSAAPPPPATAPAQGGTTTTPPATTPTDSGTKTGDSDKSGTKTTPATTPAETTPPATTPPATTPEPAATSPPPESTSPAPATAAPPAESTPKGTDSTPPE